MLFRSDFRVRLANGSNRVPTIYRSKGVGEPPLGAAAAAIICAISDALGGHVFNRTPVTTDHIVNALAKQPQASKPLQVNSV